MSVRHHVSDAFLLDYASGALGEGWRIAVASHLALCPQCRARASALEMAGGALMVGDPRDAVLESEVSWARMKARVLGQPQDARATRSRDDQPMPGAVFPEPLRSYVGCDADSVSWRALGRGAYHYPIKTGDESAMVRLLRIPAGKPVPEHGHGGRELTLVLSGAFNDGAEVFARGDLEEADETLQHQPIATPQADCICLAVTDAPLKFRSWLVRLVQPILGI